MGNTKQFILNSLEDTAPCILYKITSNSLLIKVLLVISKKVWNQNVLKLLLWYVKVAMYVCFLYVSVTF